MVLLSARVLKQSGYVNHKNIKYMKKPDTIPCLWWGVFMDYLVYDMI